jgi:hypothetical protein
LLKRRNEKKSRRRKAKDTNKINRGAAPSQKARRKNTSSAKLTRKKSLKQTPALNQTHFREQIQHVKIDLRLASFLHQVGQM